MQLSAAQRWGINLVEKIQKMLLPLVILVTVCAIGILLAAHLQKEAPLDAMSTVLTNTESTEAAIAIKPMRSIPGRGSAALRETISAGSEHATGIKPDGSAVAAGENKNGQCEVSGWCDIVAVITMSKEDEKWRFLYIE